MKKETVHLHADGNTQDHVTSQPMVIVGGGIAGIYAVLLIQKLFPAQKIVLVEQSDRLGGLLASKQFDGYWFDFGTHVPRHTGHDEIDDILFSSLPETAFRKFQNINAGNVSLHKCLYTASPNPFLATPLNHQREQQLKEIQAGKIKQSSPDNLEQQLFDLFGQSLTEMFFRPSLQKRFDTDLSKLAVNAHMLVGLSRVILGSAHEMRQLKKHPEYDRVLAFAEQTEGMSQLINYYPTCGKGIGEWIGQLTKQFNRDNIEIYTESSIKSIEMSHGQAKRLTIESGNGTCVDYPCSHLFWCGPVFPLLTMTKANYKSRYRPQIRKTYLYHFGLDQAPLVESNYVNINDPQLHSFRVTLYSNLSPVKTSVHKITVEVISDAQVKELPTTQEIINEMMSVGIISSQTKCLFNHKDTVNAGFPVITPDFLIEAQAQASTALKHIDNLCLLGKSKGSAFFMQDVLIDTHQQISQLLVNSN